jgi:abortive infection bacteriophage resistance protein
MPVYTKQHLSDSAQVALLQMRGLAVPDTAKAEECLKWTGYYRLSDYWHPLRKRAAGGVVLDDFVSGASFDDVVELDAFDRQLRLLLFGAIESIEVAVRVAIAYEIGKVATFPENDPSIFEPRFLQSTTGQPSRFDHWRNRYDKAKRDSKEDFIRHFNAKNSGALPVWAGIEIWDFGMLSVFYSGLRHNLRQPIAHSLGVGNPVLLSSWLRTLNFVRNICAHHSRLWNRNLVDRPKTTGQGVPPELHHLQQPLAAPLRMLPAERVYGAIAVAQYLLRNLSPDDPFSQDMCDLLSEMPRAFGDGGQMGFPANWQQLPLWQ